MPGPLVPAGFEGAAAENSRWLDEFHAGSRAVMTEVYVDYFSSVERSVGRILRGADQETVVHEVFFRILADAGLRGSFRGGSLRAWISTVARNHAIDYHRRQERELPSGMAEDVSDETEGGASFEASLEARQLVHRFREEWLPDKWRPVFDVRFLEQMQQSEAARTLGIHRTTLLYQELRIRQLLRKFLLKAEVA